VLGHVPTQHVRDTLPRLRLNAISHLLPPHSNTPPCLSIAIISLSSAPTTPQGAAIGHVAKTRPTHAASSPPLFASSVIFLTLAPACICNCVSSFFTCASSWAYQTFALALPRSEAHTRTHRDLARLSVGNGSLLLPTARTPAPSPISNTALFYIVRHVMSVIVRTPRLPPIPPLNTASSSRDTFHVTHSALPSCLPSAYHPSLAKLGTSRIHIRPPLNTVFGTN